MTQNLHSAWLLFVIFISSSVAGKSDIYSVQNDQAYNLTKAILIEPNYTGLDCYFNPRETCYWTWDKDNYTEAQTDHKPGQNGFIRLDAEDIKRYHSKWTNEFFGPYLDSKKVPGKLFFHSVLQVRS